MRSRPLEEEPNDDCVFALELPLITQKIELDQISLSILQAGEVFSKVSLHNNRVRFACAAGTRQSKGLECPVSDFMNPSAECFCWGIWVLI